MKNTMISTDYIEPKSIPLVVDLDGSFIKTELPWESFLYVLKEHPIEFIKIIFKKMSNRKACYFKIELQKWTQLDLTKLSFSEKFLAFLKQEKSSGRSLILCTGSTQSYAEEIQKLTGLFDSVFGSTLGFNLVGKNKAQFLLKKYGEKQFDYAGNSLADLKVAVLARRFIMVSPSLAAQVCLKKIVVYRKFIDRYLDPIIFIQTIGLPLWCLNCLMFVFVLPSNFFILLCSVGLFNFLATGFSIFFKMMNISTDREVLTRKSKNLFSTGDFSCFAGFYICILFFVLSLGLLLFLALLKPMTIVSVVLYVFGIYLWAYKKIGFWLIPKIIRYVWLGCIILLQGFFIMS